GARVGAAYGGAVRLLCAARMQSGADGSFARDAADTGTAGRRTTSPGGSRPLLRRRPLGRFDLLARRRRARSDPRPACERRDPGEMAGPRAAGRAGRVVRRLDRLVRSTGSLLGLREP